MRTSFHLQKKAFFLFSFFFHFSFFPSCSSIPSTSPSSFFFSGSQMQLVLSKRSKSTARLLRTSELNPLRASCTAKVPLPCPSLAKPIQTEGTAFTSSPAWRGWQKSHTVSQKFLQNNSSSLATSRPPPHLGSVGVLTYTAQ